MALSSQKYLKVSNCPLNEVKSLALNSSAFKEPLSSPVFSSLLYGQLILFGWHFLTSTLGFSFADKVLALSSLTKVLPNLQTLAQILPKPPLVTLTERGISNL